MLAWIAGLSAASCDIRCGSKNTAGPGIETTSNRPLLRALMPRRLLRMFSTRSSTAEHSSRKYCASGTASSRPLRRSNSFMPSSASRFAIIALTEGWVRCRFRAAAVTEPVSMISWKAFIWLSFMTATL